jgi:hypothetical protein
MIKLFIKGIKLLVSGIVISNFLLLGSNGIVSAINPELDYEAVNEIVEEKALSIFDAIFSDALSVPEHTPRRLQLYDIVYQSEEIADAIELEYYK